MTAIDERIRRLAVPAELDDEHLDRLWHGIEQTLQDAAPSRRRSRRVSGAARPALVACAIMFATCGVALGASETLRAAASDIAVRAIDVFRGQTHDAPIEPGARDLVKQLEAGRDDVPAVGRFKLDDARTLATHTRGGVRATLAAVPTDRDALCLTMSVEVAGQEFRPGGIACIGPLDASRPIGTSGSYGSATHAVVGGIALDRVTAVELRVDGRWEPVELTNHAFVWVAPTPKSRITAMRATLDGGYVELPAPGASPGAR